LAAGALLPAFPSGSNEKQTNLMHPTISTFLFSMTSRKQRRPSAEHSATRPRVKSNPLGDE
jgi:hypothetical protein